MPSDILIALDEAYVEYIRDGLTPDSFGLVRKHRNVVVLRTFSKAYGLAGLRIGYAVGDPDIITALGKVYVPFTATSISQAAAVASRSTPPTNCWPAPTPSSPNAPASPPHFTKPDTLCRRHRPTSSGCHCPDARRSSPTTRRTAASSSAPTAMACR